MNSEAIKRRQSSRRHAAALTAVCGMLLFALACSEQSNKNAPSSQSSTKKNDEKASKTNDGVQRHPADGISSHVPPADDQPAPPTGDSHVDAPGQSLDDPGVVAPSEDTLFKGWENPKAVLVITGLLDGHVEPCGCTGLENQKGGLMRRHTLLRQMADERKWNVVPIDLGQFVHRFGRQAEIKYQRTLDAMRTMGYRAISFGPKDLRLNAGELYATIAADDPLKTPFVSANVRFFSADDPAVPAVKIIQAGDVKIGLTSVMDETFQRDVGQSDEIVFLPVDSAIDGAVAELTKQNCDLLVLMAYATMEETKRLAEKYPQFDVVATAGGASEPPRLVERLDDSGRVLIETGQKGSYAPVVGLFEGKGAERLQYQLVPIDHRFKDSADMEKMMAVYQQQLEAAWKDGFSRLGIRPAAHSSGHKFVGSAACADCHAEAFEVWKNSLHSHAMETLVRPPERPIARNFDPECVACHAVGWDSRQYRPYESGFVDLKSTPLLSGVGCESCHGPGSRHVGIENGDVEADEQAQTKARDQMKLMLVDAERKCVTCHDIDNSPDFHKEGKFEEYWEQIKH